MVIYIFTVDYDKLVRPYQSNDIYRINQKINSCGFFDTMQEYEREEDSGKRVKDIRGCSKY